MECVAAEREAAEASNGADSAAPTVHAAPIGGQSGQTENVMNPKTFTPPDVLAGPAIVIEYCDRVGKR